MADPKLTAVICFANEGVEVERTVQGLRDTCGDDIHILLINDASTDEVDYESVADRFGCRYFQNTEQVGPAHSRQKGIRWAKTDNVILLDAHMRFYENGWHRIVNDTIDADPNALYCTRSRPLKAGGVYKGGVTGHGASIIFKEETFEASLKVKWNTDELAQSGVSYVPCVLGGNYAMRRDFMEHIGSYRGLHRYGGEEPLISVKAWLAGGSCKLINDVDIGHIYRDAASIPWHDLAKYQQFNKLVTARILMGDDDFNQYWQLAGKLPNAPSAQNVFRSRQTFVMQARGQFEAVRQRPLQYFYELNQSFQRGEAITPSPRRCNFLAFG